ncbi:MAG: VWA domain-containing protein [Clostridia bacterium]
MKRNNFPFSAVLGQNELKNVLIWNLVNPKIGGVLISGEKGTAKSTLVRGLSDITNKLIVEIPLNTTEDRLIGSINFEKAIKFGLRSFEPGLLQKANGNILYIDEVNLLADNLIKSILDVSSSGECIVEREGISHRHSSVFTMIGSMNIEEGGLRPQFIDRFGLFIDIKGENNANTRADVVERRLSFEKNYDEFIKEFEEEQDFLKAKISQAISKLHKVQVLKSAYDLAAQLSRDGNCAGHRAEITIIETAKAIAVLENRLSVEHSDIMEATKYALPHRVREMPPQNTEDDEQQEEPQQEPEQNSEQENQEPEEQQKKDSEPPKETAPQNGDSLAQEKVDESGEIFAVGKWLENKTKQKINKGSGRRSLVKTNYNMGRYVKSSSKNSKSSSSDLAFDATLRAAAPYQKSRDKKGMAIAITDSDIRIKQREKRVGNYILFVVDASGSMGAKKRMKTVKAAVLSLLGDAYQKRDKVGLVMFKQQSAELILDMTRSVDLAQKKMETLPTGGKTPLCFGIEMAQRTVKTAMYKEKDILPVVVLISDGRATFGRSKNAFNDAIESARALANEKIKAVVIDAEQDFIKLGMAKKIADEMNADYIKLDELKTQSLLSAVGMTLH